MCCDSNKLPEEPPSLRPSSMFLVGINTLKMVSSAIFASDLDIFQYFKGIM